ncbi:Hypothetical predicted protein [Mytilus galloprovincialis]|uniref:Uncharacterized protein n=1 Tax=Mytilus galloprovincialis TaxID=29158 RepID=A0A8B6CN43_MYTGA|nr:Hypothetical predicted protein [Mytilus galloprovincialis]
MQLNVLWIFVALFVLSTAKSRRKTHKQLVKDCTEYGKEQLSHFKKKNQEGEDIHSHSFDELRWRKQESSELEYAAILTLEATKKLKTEGNKETKNRASARELEYAAILTLEATQKTQNRESTREHEYAALLTLEYTTNLTQSHKEPQTRVSTRELEYAALLTLEATKKLKTDYTHVRGHKEPQTRVSTSELEYAALLTLETTKKPRTDYTHVRGHKETQKIVSTRELEYAALLTLEATKKLKTDTGMCLSELQNDPELLEIWTSLVDCRNFTGTCDENYPYRSVDGSCNNLDYPEWGKSFTPQERFVSAHYEDGIDYPRDYDLPSPRLISNKLFNDTGEGSYDKRKTAEMMAWGQLLAHDFVLTPTIAKVDCCDQANEDNPACFTIEVPEDDAHFTSTCMNFVRSSPATVGCVPDRRFVKNHHLNVVHITFLAVIHQVAQILVITRQTVYR